MNPTDTATPVPTDTPTPVPTVTITPTLGPDQHLPILQHIATNSDTLVALVVIIGGLVVLAVGVFLVRSFRS